MEIYCVEKNITSQVGHLSPSTLCIMIHNISFDVHHRKCLVNKIIKKKYFWSFYIRK